MCKAVFEKHAPLKKKYLRANHSKFVAEELSKVIMLRSKLRERFLKDRTEESRCKYKKQRNVCVYLIKKGKKDYYENIDVSNSTDSNKFWKTVRPIFGSKIKSRNSITLAEGTKLFRKKKNWLKHSTSFLSVL